MELKWSKKGINYTQIYPEQEQNRVKTLKQTEKAENILECFEKDLKDKKLLKKLKTIPLNQSEHTSRFLFSNLIPQSSTVLN